MRILVHPHELGIGGSQLNAVEIAAAVHRLGHRVIVFGRPGPLIDRVNALGLDYVEAPEPLHHPSRRVVRALAALVRTHRLDVLHGYEWPPALDCVLASRLGPAVAVGTVMSMSVVPFLPHSLPLAVGTDEIADAERARGRTDVQVIVPPVDLSTNGPDVVLPDDDFAARWGLDPARASVVCVTRLARELKLEGLLAAMDAVGRLTATRPVQLVVVGDGPARAQVHEHAARVNARAGAGTVVLVGELVDPRPAYAAADVVLGMGGSALRAMAFAKPLVVQGELGFWRLLTPGTAATFERVGWYGRGTDAAAGAGTLHGILADLLARPGRRAELGRFGRALVERRYSLDAAAAAQLDMYESALRRPRAPRRTVLRDDAVAVARLARHQAARRVRRVRGAHASDDANAHPVTAPSEDAHPVVYLAGASWDAVAGTDRHLADALARRRPVVWADPPVSWLHRGRSGGARVEQVAPSVVRVRSVGPPLVSRPGVRAVARTMVARNVRRALREAGATPAAVLVASPDPLVRLWHRDAVTIYHATDDFGAGARLLGYSPRYLARAQRSNAGRADLTLAVSPPLRDALAPYARAVDLLPNGCAVDVLDGVPRRDAAGRVDLAPPVAGVIGQLNDRLDVALLEAVADRGDSLLLVGPRSERRADTARRLDSLLARPNVQWVDRCPTATVPDYLAAIRVGLTPYADTGFNRSSFPLKTLEYLAAGRAVVSTDLPAVHWLDTDLIVCAQGPDRFADAVHDRLHAPVAADEIARRQAFAAAHSWDARAGELDEFIRGCAVRRGHRPEHDEEHRP